MKIIIAKVKVADGKESEFEKVALELAANVEANEPGNKFYTACKSEEGEYFFVEAYEDDEAIAAHRASAHLRESGSRFAEVMAGRPQVTVLDVLGK